jgi:hypothetical protein
VSPEIVYIADCGFLSDTQRPHIPDPRTIFSSDPIIDWLRYFEGGEVIGYQPF